MIWVIIKREVVRIMANKDGVPEHWIDIHEAYNHPGNFSEGCEICLRLFNNPKIRPAVKSVQSKKHF